MPVPSLFITPSNSFLREGGFPSFTYKPCSFFRCVDAPVLFCSLVRDVGVVISLLIQYTGRSEPSMLLLFCRSSKTSFCFAGAFHECDILSKC